MKSLHLALILSLCLHAGGLVYFVLFGLKPAPEPLFFELSLVAYENSLKSTTPKEKSQKAQIKRSLHSAESVKNETVATEPFVNGEIANRTAKTEAIAIEDLTNKSISKIKKIKDSSTNIKTLSQANVQDYGEPPPIDSAPISSYKLEGGDMGSISDSGLPQRAYPVSEDGVVTDQYLSQPARLKKIIKAYRSEEARKKDFTGTAEVELIVDERGVVVDIKKLNDLPFGLNKVTDQIILQLEFEPALDQGLQPVKSKVLFKIKYTQSN